MVNSNCTNEKTKKKCYRVFCLETHRNLYFVSRTALEAMKALIYYLNLSVLDRGARVDLAGGGRTLTVVHNNLTYSCINN